jgi:hypothetical protein
LSYWNYSKALFIAILSTFGFPWIKQFFPQTTWQWVCQTAVCHPAMDLDSFTVTQQMLPGQILFSIPMQHQVSALDALRDRRVQQLFPARHRGGYSLGASAFCSKFHQPRNVGFVDQN